MTQAALSWGCRALAVGVALWLLGPDALFALVNGWTQVGLWGGGLDVVYPDAARAFGAGRLALLAAAVVCIVGLEKRRGFFLEERGRGGLALYDFPQQAAGGLSVVGIFAYTLGMMLHFFEAWSVAAVVFAVLLGALLSFYVLGALGTDGEAEAAVGDAGDFDSLGRLEWGGV